MGGRGLATRRHATPSGGIDDPKKEMNFVRTLRAKFHMKGIHIMEIRLPRQTSGRALHL